MSQSNNTFQKTTRTKARREWTQAEHQRKKREKEPRGSRAFRYGCEL